MEVGSRVWVRDAEAAWVLGTVLSKAETSLAVEVEEEVSEEPLTFSIPKDEGQGVELDSVKLANEEEHDAVDDLIQLPHLHEASILHSLTQRFEMGSIYTFTANAILLAVNPFKSLPLYSRELLQQYYNAGYTVSQGIEVPPLPPHVFAIADSAYRDMMHGIQGSKGGSASSINQSILISGESGAGKTESTKFVMKYLTTVGNADGLVELEEGSVMDRVLQSNPILEAFGNAKTIRNDNSSRFGKFIELMFDKRGNLLGAGIETYLLETVRIPNQSPDERNFHIFYQMTKGASEAERERWALDSPDCYQFTNQGDCYDLSRMDDEEEFARTKRAMELMGFSTEAQTSILDLGAALLHLGQLEFEGEDHSSICMDNGGGEVFSHVLRLACLPEDGLKRALTEKTIEVGAGKEVHTLKLKDVQAYDARDALAKALYGNIFNYVVRTINVNINCSKKDVKASVGVLDIFGFECFQKNSFEQLCINYTNETLQQQFNEFVFKMEQKEYTKEGIEWSFVEFPDNQDCLDLIESRPNGLFAMLDDECRMGIRGSDANYASRLYKAHEGSGRFSATQNQKTNLQFSLRHYAGEVEYTVETFLDKNKDELPKETDDLFGSSQSEFIRDLFSGSSGGDKKPGSAGSAGRSRGKPTPKKATSSSVGADSKKPTVGTQFKDQLQKLMAMIRETRPHYIRCVKPNDVAQPDEVHRVRVMEQLRYGGVLEAVRVARSGYPVRLPHKDFYGRYRLLLTKTKSNPKKYPTHLRNMTADAAKKKCEELVNNVLIPVIGEARGIPAETIQFGKSKVFLRKNAYDALEMIRSRCLLDAGVKIQAIVRGFVYRKSYTMQIRAALTLQRVGRGKIGRAKAQRVREYKASTRVQAAFRRYKALRHYIVLKRGAILFQARFRGGLARVVYLEMRKEKMALRLQAWGRMAPKKRKYRSLRTAVLALQCKQRVIVAKRIFRAVKLEAKDVGNLKRDNEKLKEEIQKLRESAKYATESKQASDKLAEAHQEVDQLKNEVSSLEKQLAELVDLPAEVAILKSTIVGLEEQLAVSESASKEASGEKVKLLADIAQLKLAHDALVAQDVDDASDCAPEPEVAPVVVLSKPDSVLEGEVVRLKSELTSRDEMVQELRKALHRAESERTKADEMVHRLSESLKERAGALSAAVPIADSNGPTSTGDDDAEFKTDDLLKNDDLLMSDLLERLEEEKSTRRRMEVENAKLRSQLEKMPPNDGLPVKSPSSRPVGRHIRERSFASTMESPRHSAATCVSPGHYVPKSARRAHARSPSSGFSFPKSPSRRSSAESVVTDLVHAEELVGMDESHVAKAQQQFRRHSSSIAAKRETTVHEFEDRLQSIKDWLRAGVPVTVWDGRNKKVDALLYLNESTQSHVPSLEFKPHGAFLVGWRYSLKPLVLDHLLQAQMGVPGDFDGLESGDSLCMAVLHVAAGEEDPDRTVVLKCANEETKKQLYSGIRKLLTEASFRPKVVQPAPIVVGNSPEGSPRNSASNKEAKRKIGELEGELLEERTKYERVMLQMMETTNDINNKEEEIQRLRTELSHSQNELDALRKEKSLSIAASSQMNKKHNDLQFEFEEQQDELEVLKNKCRMLVEQLRIADQQCASIGAVSLPSAGTPN